jgi:hypothetical protein
MKRIAVEQLFRTHLFFFLVDLFDLGIFAKNPAPLHMFLAFFTSTQPMCFRVQKCGLSKTWTWVYIYIYIFYTLGIE